MSANCPEAIAVKLERVVASSAEVYVFVERSELRRLLTEHRYLEGQLQVVANQLRAAKDGTVPMPAVSHIVTVDMWRQLSKADEFGTLICDGPDIALVVPTEDPDEPTFRDDAVINVVQRGTQRVVIEGAIKTSMHRVVEIDPGKGFQAATHGQHSMILLRREAPNAWTVHGDRAPAEGGKHA